MCKTLTILILFLCFRPADINSQVSLRVMSYNVENLFDTADNPLTDDNEFLPSGGRRWTRTRYYHKLQQIAKVIMAAGEWGDAPALVGLCEVENDTVITHLLRKTPLHTRQYRYCASGSPDRRGIGVALLYQRDKFRYLSHHSIPVQGKDHTRKTRDILHVSGELISGDTLDILVCHFPSKYGGEKESESRRTDAAVALRKQCDLLIQVRSCPLIIAMGDFNDSPGSRCMKLVTGNSLQNLFADAKGSHKYQGEWSQLDQIIVHQAMLSPQARMKVIPGSAQNFSPSFLFVQDKTWRGIRPRRTYYGYKYEAGYSDHLPVLADFLIDFSINHASP
ncbi:MAG: endonuclease [Tannerellaceae bacterium]|jgi:endonuclease/exonuclease/phosphatase family metal-dependent hydrolase|nr:endonuclease [Tannerellaceae bacterium]